MPPFTNVIGCCVCTWLFVLGRGVDAGPAFEYMCSTSYIGLTSSCSFVQNWFSFNSKDPKMGPKIARNSNTWQNSFLTRSPADLHLDTRMMDWLLQLVSPPDQKCLAADQVSPSRIKSIIPRAAGISPVSEVSPQEQISPLDQKYLARYLSGPQTQLEWLARQGEGRWQMGNHDFMMMIMRIMFIIFFASLFHDVNMWWQGWHLQAVTCFFSDQEQMADFDHWVAFLPTLY